MTYECVLLRAAQVLSDEEKRREYDAYGHAGPPCDDGMSSGFGDDLFSTSFSSPFGTLFDDDLFSTDFTDVFGARSSHRGRRVGGHRMRDQGGVGSYKSSEKTETVGGIKVTTKTVAENGRTTVTVTKVDANTGELISENVDGRERTPPSTATNSKRTNVAMGTDRHTRDRPSRGSSRGIPDVKATRGSPHDGPRVAESSPMSVRARLVPTEERSPKKPRQQKSNRHRGSTCHVCGQHGHLKRDCPNRAPAVPVSDGSLDDVSNVDPALTVDQRYVDECVSAAQSVDPRDMPSAHDDARGIDEANAHHVGSASEPSAHDAGGACQPDANDVDVTRAPWTDFVVGTDGYHTDIGASNVAVSVDFDGLHGNEWGDHSHSSVVFNHSDGGCVAPLASCIDVPAHGNSGGTVVDAVSASYFDGGEDTHAVLQMDENPDVTTLTSDDVATTSTECADAGMNERVATDAANSDDNTLVTPSDDFQFPFVNGVPDPDDADSDAHGGGDDVQYSSGGSGDRDAVGDSALPCRNDADLEKTPRHVVAAPESPRPPQGMECPRHAVAAPESLPLPLPEWPSLADAAATGRKGRRGRW